MTEGTKRRRAPRQTPLAAVTACARELDRLSPENRARAFRLLDAHYERSADATASSERVDAIERRVDHLAELLDSLNVRGEV